MTSPIGNRVTDPALQATNEEEKIRRALAEIETALGWTPVPGQTLFTGTYYDRQKVGSLIVPVTNNAAEKAVLKLQLNPVKFDEGRIIRHIAAQNRSERMAVPTILADRPWDDVHTYGYIVFEDLTALPKLWQHPQPDPTDLARHEEFLRVFTTVLQPMPSWIPEPTVPFRQIAADAFQHFSTIAATSSHHHLSETTFAPIRAAYLGKLAQIELGVPHFTHGHLSGKDVLYDEQNDRFVLLANLYWSYRPRFYEVIFPLWVDLMSTRDPQISLADMKETIERWSALGTSVYTHDVRKEPVYWFSLLTLGTTTIMLDLGASDWPEEDRAIKQNLLDRWQEVFWWILKEKLT